MVFGSLHCQDCIKRQTICGLRSVCNVDVTHSNDYCRRWRGSKRGPNPAIVWYSIWVLLYPSCFPTSSIFSTLRFPQCFFLLLDWLNWLFFAQILICSVDFSMFQAETSVFKLLLLCVAMHSKLKSTMLFSALCSTLVMIRLTPIDGWLHLWIKHKFLFICIWIFCTEHTSRLRARSHKFFLFN